MTIKQQVINMLTENIGNYISGEDIAAALGCSRGAVWKAVKILKNDGYAIDAVTNKGYKLDTDADILSFEGVNKYIDKKLSGLDIQVFSSIDSTNNYLKSIAESGAKEGTIAIASQQTGGKGRLGRSFFSPADSGLYMSILLRPRIQADKAVRITTVAAVAVAMAAQKAFGVSTDIKWVNDVYIKGKKICGILTEASLDMESGGLDYAVCGIGINIYEPKDGFPEEIRQTAGAILAKRTADAKNKMAAELINSFFELYTSSNEKAYLSEYKKRLIWVGEQISLIRGEKSVSATMLGVNDDCALLVRYDDGTEATITSGEISIRKKT